MIWPFFASSQFIQNYMVPVAHHLSELDHTEILSFFFASPQNNMVSDVPVLFQ